MHYNMFNDRYYDMDVPTDIICSLRLYNQADGKKNNRLANR